MSTPIEDYALIGDGETAALVNRSGSVDWLCWPRFDDDACFAALLGTRENGCWSIAPVAPISGNRRRYQDDTLIIETDFETAHGAVRLIDFMPIRGTISSLIRIVVGLRGRVPLRLEMRLRFDYGALPPWSEPAGNGFVAKLGPDLVVLHAAVPVRVEAHAAEAEFSVEKGERLAFVLRYGSAHQDPPEPIDAEAELAGTQAYWREWAGRFDTAKTAWPELVKRSLITLKAMIHRPSGGLVAAPTTSLPEAAGGSMNWDYRYCWLRDATFTLGALLNAGYLDEATAWRDWLLRAIAGSPERMRIMYRIDGARHLAEWTSDSLPGYRNATPVLIGNAASTQHQIDVYGEVMDCMFLAHRGGIPLSGQEWRAGTKIIEHLETMWDTPGSGIWESRDKPRQYTYSKVMAWVAVDCYLRQRPPQGMAADPALVERLTALRQTMHDSVCNDGWNEGVGSFTQYYGGEEIDASLLLVPIVGFLPADDPRVVRTVERIERELSEGGLIRRTKAKVDGISEGAFLACSCWMADCLNLMGRTEDARAQFERVLAVCNDIGLLAEEYNVPGRCLAGNFPQALTHLALVNTALGLGGSTFRRGDR